MPNTHVPAAAEGMQNFSRRESDDGYQPIVAILGDRWRVIECRDHIQWILQFSKRSGRDAAWRGCRYVRTRAGLMAACARSVPELTPSALALLEALPERI